MILLTTDDFEDFNSIALSIKTTPVLQEYIDRYEEGYIKQLLGVELGQKFIDDLPEESESGDMEDRFTAILQPFIEQPDCHIHESKGIKDILACLIFFEYISKTQVKHSQAGVENNQAEVSTIANPEEAMRFAEGKWNYALDSIEAVQWYCSIFKRADYPEYKGIKFKPKYSAVL